MKKIVEFIVCLCLFVGCSQEDSFSSIAEKQMYNCFKDMSDENETFTIIDSEKTVSNDSLFCCRVKVESSKKEDYVLIDYVYIKIYYEHNEKYVEKELLLNPIEYSMGDIFKWSEERANKFDEVMDKVQESIKRWEEKQGNTYNTPINSKSKIERLYDSLYMYSITNGKIVREYYK